MKILIVPKVLLHPGDGMLADDAQPRLLASTASASSCATGRRSLSSQPQRLYLTMPAVGTQLYFLAGYQVPSGDDSFRTVSLVHSFKNRRCTEAGAGLEMSWAA